MAISVNNPHDKFFKSIMNEINVAKAIISTFLSRDILNLIDIDSLQHAKTNFVSEELKETFSDVVFSAKMKSKKEVFISFLLEHKSYPDIFTAVQVLFYLASGYYSQYKNSKKLQVIIPLVFYHGKEKWEYKSMEELFEDVPKSIRRFIPTFDTVFLDLADFSDSQLDALENSLVSAILLLQKYALRPEELAKKLHLIYSKMNSVNRERNFFREVIVYSLQLIDIKKVEEAIKELPPVIKNKVMTAYETLIQQGEYKNTVKVILNGYKAGLSIKILATLTNLSESEVIEIIQKHRK